MKMHEGPIYYQKPHCDSCKHHHVMPLQEGLAIRRYCFADGTAQPIQSYLASDTVTPGWCPFLTQEADDAD